MSDDHPLIKVLESIATAIDERVQAIRMLGNDAEALCAAKIIKELCMAATVYEEVLADMYSNAEADEE